jgi:radical SAM superfamily enzyme YgiQ (UPF0313 family)
MKRILAVNPPVICVNECQREWYSFAHPTSLLKIAAYHKTMGHHLYLIDCMEYENDWNKPLTFYQKMPIGTRDLKLSIDTYVLGKSFEWLIQELTKQKTPDEVWVSCHITFNADLAHKTIATIKKVFDKVPVVFGGNYPTLFPGDAAKSGATVYTGRLPDALTCFPDYSVFTSPPDYMVFQLTLGCENDCSHCVNHMLGPVVKFDIDALVNDIKSKRKKYETRTFVNIDPNTACYDLERFLQTIIQQKVDIDLYFFGGIQPDFVTKQLVTLMKRANVKGISLPRELDNRLNTRLKKKYTAKDFYHAIRLFENAQYDLSAFHCPFPVALRDDDLPHILSIIKEIKSMGAIAEISPISYIPGTTEYDYHHDLLQGKNLEELNWALWPSLDSMEKIQTYSLVYNMAHNYRFMDPWPIYGSIL